MAPPDERVLRLRRSDVDGDAFVLLNVTSSGSQSLDLKLLGTDGENVYVASSKYYRASETAIATSSSRPSLTLILSS